MLPAGAIVAGWASHPLEDRAFARRTANINKTITDTTVTPNTSRTWTYTYDSYGNVLTAKSPRTDANGTTTYTYYACASGNQCGQLQTVTDPVGNVTTFNTYNANGQPLTITDANGVTTTLAYDSRSRLASQETVGELTTFAYFATGELQKVTLPDGSFLQYTYDAAHRMTGIKDGAGNSIQYTLDAMGNHTVESEYDPSQLLSRTSSRVYNGLNQLYQAIGAAGTAAVTTTYTDDGNGNQTAIAAPLARNTSSVFDALNRLTQITDPSSGITHIAYDVSDNVVSVQDPANQTTTYAYNGFDELVTESSPVSGTSSYTYDSAGNVATRTDARGVGAVYSYDAAGRTTAAAYGDQTILYTYDVGTNGKGRLTGAADAFHAISWLYDALGRVSEKTQTVANVTKSVGYAYTNGQLTTLTTPSGQSITYSYANNRITGVAVNGTPIVSGVTYEPFGPARGWSWGNGTTETRSYDTDGNPSVFAGAESVSYNIDSAFRITGVTNASNNALSWTYGYDNLDRVTGASQQSAAIIWTYDGDGNRLTMGGAPGPVYAASNLAMTYNNRGRLSNVTAASESTSYLYDAIGQRIAKLSAAGNTLFMYDERGHLLGEYDGSGNLLQETLWLGEIPVATLQPNGSGGVNVYYVHTDHLNAPKVITRPSDNAIVWRWDRDPFGAAAPVQNLSGLGTFVYNLRLPGQYYDVETGLGYNYHRDYDPATGRYVESDPIGLRGGINTYIYAGGNPISFVDPFGLFLFPWESPVSVVGGTKEQQDAISAAVDRIFKTPRGQEMESQIRGPWYWHGSPKTLHVNCDMNDAGEVGGNNLFIDPTWNPDIMTPFGLRPAALDRIIAHELGHTLGTSDNGPDRMNNVRLNENPVAIALGEPVRIQY